MVIVRENVPRETATVAIIIAIVLMMPTKSALFAGAGAWSVQTPAGWKTVKDRSGRCQASVPADWTIGSGVLVGSASGSNYRSAVVLAGVREDPHKAMTPERLHELGAQTVLENTPARTFFSGAPTKPSGKVPSQTKYTLQLAGSPACTAQVTVPTGQDDALAKQIAGSVGPVK